ncbi:uncharacterized protein PV09_00173 [Verruconis gallopava]|uniref:Uncharacterized protein n=1 Tax=Verruconis gallopava TaxID=253628 RepID=A0A0D2BCV0_9PEZI|nr:uncharacterized protein PV09_00173 [Verruconis gallopava]KIW09249.1 hypothetical protein PV09_00173 [Verruconis gallopava]
MALVNTVIQATLLSMFSNILAQILDSYQKNTSLSINFTPVLHFAVYAALSTPINVGWQDWLENTFPSKRPSTANQSNSHEKANVPEPTHDGALHILNTFTKFVLDQTVGALFNIPLFIGIIGALKGQSMEHILGKIQEDSFDIYFSGMKLWPPVSLVSYVFVPPEHRVIFGSIAGVIWNIYLSLMAR